MSSIRFRRKMTIGSRELRKGKGKLGFREYTRHRELLLMLVPAIIFYVIFHYGPMYGAQIAFRDFKFNRGFFGSPWVGLEHFTYMFSLKSFREVFRNTVVISFLKLIFGFPAPLILALLLNEIRAVRLKKVIQTVSYLPHFLSWIILSGIFIQLLSIRSGPVNILLKTIGLEPIFFFGDPSWFRFTLVVTSIFKGVGWSSIIYLASIAGINPEIYEAALIDGTNRFQRAIHITIPSITPVITILLIFAVGSITKDDLNQILNLYNPAVYSVGDVLSTYTYRRGLVDLQFSFAAAVGLFQNVIAFTLVILANWISKRVSETSLW